MADTPPDKQSEEDISNDDMEQKGEVQVTDPLVPEIRKGEGEKEVVPAQDEGTINRQVETDSEPSKEHSSLASLVTTYSDNPE